MEKLRKAVISGESWGNLGPTRPGSHVSTQPAECGCHMGKPAPKLGLPITGTALALCHTLSRTSLCFCFLFLKILSMSSGLLHKHSVARQPSSLLLSLISRNSVQANSWEHTYSQCCLPSQLSSLTPGFPTRNTPVIELVCLIF